MDKSLGPSLRYRANTPKVIFEAFDDETVLINLDSGNYYSFGGSGALFWDLVTAGQSVAETVAALRTRFPKQDGAMESAVHDFIDELMTEGLIVEGRGETSEVVPGSRTAPEIGLTDFEKPTILKYSDMAELLLLDPIHEVDETGWPRAVVTEPNAKGTE